MNRQLLLLPRLLIYNSNFLCQKLVQYIETWILQLRQSSFC